MIGQDFRQAARTLRQQPGFALIAISTLALGIAACTVIFSVMYAVLIAPLPYRDPGRIVALTAGSDQDGARATRISGNDLEEIRKGSDAFDAIGYSIGGEMGVQLADRAEFVGAYFVNPDFLRIFQVAPSAGRLLNDADVDRAAVVSARFAGRNFADPQHALGRTLSIENRVYSIAGVLPDGFAYPANGDVWIAAPPRPLHPEWLYPVVARLRSGATLAAAQTEISGIASRLAHSEPSNRRKTLLALQLQDQLTGPVRASLYLLMGAVVLVLLIACANVANLLLAKSAARSREMAIRAALGAGRWRLARQLLAESIVLGTAGAAAGLVLAKLGIGAAARFAPPNLLSWHEAGLQWPVLLFAAAVSLAASVLFGLMPAWQAARTDLDGALKRTSTRGLARGGSKAMRRALAIAEIALAMILAAGAGLLFRSFLAMRAVDLGFRTEKLLVMYAHVPARSLQEHLNAAKLMEDLLPQLRAIPGVKSVAVAMGIPAGQYSARGAYAIEGQQTREGNRARLPQAGFRLAGPNYFATMGISLRAGRDVSEADQYNTPLVALVSEALVRQSFPGEDPLGKRIWCGLNKQGTWMTIVGIVGDVRQDSPASRTEPQIYMPLDQHPYYANEVQVLLRTSVEPASVIGAARKTAQSASPMVATKFTTMQAMTAAAVAAPRLRTVLMALFAALALLLAATGVYSVMAALSTERTAELGLRMALGATADNVVWLILAQTATLAAAGICVGTVVSAALGRALRSLLFGVQPADAATFCATIAVVTLSAAVAALVPALRAARIDPLAALRQE